MSFTRISLFGPVPGQFPFIVSSVATFTLSSITSTGGRSGIIGHVPATTSFNAVFDTQIVGAVDLPLPVASVLQGGTLSLAYSETISAKGGISPYAFSVSSGSLPTGLSLNSSTGVISGTPTAIGTYSFTIQAKDSLLNFGTQGFIITIAAAGGGSFTFLA